MKIIELLNKIANGEEVPKKIKFYGKYYIWYDNGYTGNKGYCLEPLKADSNSFLEINTVYDLNKGVEIIEEDKEIEKINDILRVDDLEPPYDCNLEKIWVQTIKNHNKINELIDKVNSLENKQ